MDQSVASVPTAIFGVPIVSWRYEVFEKYLFERWEEGVNAHSRAFHAPLLSCNHHANEIPS